MRRVIARQSHRVGVVLLAVLVATALTVQSTAGQAARQLDQQQTAQTPVVGFVDITNFGLGTLSGAGQTFTAGLTGTMDQIDLAVEASALVDDGLYTLEIRDVVAGAPGTTVLASTTFLASSLPATAALPIPFQTFSLSPGAPVVAGTQYAFVLRAPAPPPVLNVAVRLAFAIGDPYTDPKGQAFTQTGFGPFLPAPGADATFQTYVTPATVTVGNAQLAEGNSGTSNLVFPVTLSFPVAAPVTVPFSFGSSSATGAPSCATNVDFMNSSGSITIPAGSTTGSIPAPVCGDTTPEPDETILLLPGVPTNAVRGTTQATGTILNDDAAAQGVAGPAPAVAAAPGSADVRITKTGPANATLGSNPVYTITVTNFGPATAENVTVNDPTPAGLTFVSNTNACTTVFPCALGALGPGQTRIITTTFNVPQGYAGADPIVNVATVTSTTADPNTTNNTAQAKTTPQGQVYDPNNNGKGDKKDPDEKSKQTEEQELNEQHTNTGGKDQYAISGQVIAVEKSPDGGYLLVSIKTIDPEPLVVQIYCEKGDCPNIQVGDILEADGHQNGVGDGNTYFVASDGFSIERNGKKIK